MKKNLLSFVMVLFSTNVCLAQKVDSVEMQKNIDYYAPRLWVVGDGTVTKAINGEKSVPVNTSVGVIFSKNFARGGKQSFVVDIRNLNCEAYISVASTADTIVAEIDTNNNYSITNSREFGSYVSFPVGSKQSASVLIQGLFDNRNFNGLQNIFLGGGYAFKTFFSNRVWKLNNDSSIQVSCLSVKAATFHELLPYGYSDNGDYSIYVSVLSVSMRAIGGDIVNSSGTYVNRFIGTNQNTYLGWEPFFGFKLKNLRAEFSYPMFVVLGGKSIPGLSGGQFTATVSFTGGFPVALKRNPIIEADELLYDLEIKKKDSTELQHKLQILKKDSVLNAKKAKRWVYQIGDLMDNDEAIIKLYEKLNMIEGIALFKKKNKYFFFVNADIAKEDQFVKLQTLLGSEILTKVDLMVYGKKKKNKIVKTKCLKFEKGNDKIEIDCYTIQK